MNFRIRPIHTIEDYNASIEYLNLIFDAKEGTPEADEKEILSILIEKYEDENYSIDPPSPIEAIKFRMEQEGLTQKDLVPFIGSPSKVSEILSGNRFLTLKMIRALNKHLGIPSEILLQEYSSVDINDLSEIEFEKFPLDEMKKYGAFDGFDTENLKDRAEEAIRFLINKSGGLEEIPAILFRKTSSTRLNAKVDPYALQGWFLLVLSKCSSTKNIAPYVAENINKPFLKGLISLSVLADGPLIAQEYLANHGILLKIVPHLKNTYLDGASLILNNGTPVIVLTLRYDRIDNYWFTLFHEIAHIKMHLDKGDYITDDMTLKGSKNDNSKELEADDFAEKMILPENFDLHLKDALTKEEIIAYANNQNIHPAIIAGRIQYMKKNYRLFSNLVGRGKIRCCFENQNDQLLKI